MLFRKTTSYVLVAVSASAVALGAHRACAADPPPPATYLEYMEVSPHPDVAEQRKFLAYLLRGWDYRLDRGSDKNLCAAALKEMASDPNIAFLTPDAFDAAKPPQAFTDIGKQCPNLHIGMAWDAASEVDSGGRPPDWVEPVTEKDLTALYGEPVRAKKDFALFNIKVGKSVVPVFFAEDGRWFELIDAKRCTKEKLEPPYGREESRRGTGMMHGFLKLKSGTYFLDVDRGGGPYIRITRIPADVNPNRPGGGITECRFSGAAPRRQ